jgi:CheY-like chemotaxis protein
MLIDDDKVCNFMSKRVLSKKYNNPDLSIFTDAFQALEHLRKCLASNNEFPDILFVDINMPLMDGWEFLDYLEKFPDEILSKCHVFVLSSSISSHDIAKSKTYKRVRKYITKPLTAEKLDNDY